MRQTSNREYQAWTEWLDRQWNEPDRTDHYLMQVAREVAYTHVNPRKVGKMKITFEKQAVGPEPVPKKMTRKQAADAARARWTGRVLQEKKHGRG